MYNLKKGFQQIKLTKTKPEIEAFKKEARNILGVEEVQRYRYFNGSTEIKANKLFKILDLFKKYGVKKGEML